jgi:hypothetical protein
MPLLPEQRQAVLSYIAWTRRQGDGPPTTADWAAAETAVTPQREEALARNLEQAPPPTPAVVAKLRSILRWHEMGGAA